MPAILPSGLPTFLDPGTYVPGSPLISYRQLAFGSYLFPLTCQLKSDAQKLGLDQKRVPFGIGDHIPLNTNLAAREVEITGLIGTGLIGAGGTTIISATQLETERAALAGLQQLGHQPLFTRWDRFRMAFLNEFDCTPEQDYGEWRYMTFDCKFLCDDPRSFGVTQHSNTLTLSSTTPASFSASHSGNVPAFPTITFTGLSSPGVSCGTGPVVGMQIGTSVQQVRFSQLQLFGGDTLVVQCDPRPEYRCAAAAYTASGGVPINAMGYVLPTDFEQEIDFTQFFPFINAGAGNLFYAAMSSGSPNVSAEVQWLDTWV